MLNGDIVSIIVPVYNAEKTLKCCIDSLIGQSYNDIQVILIDDGSTDASAQICDEYAGNDKRIKAVHIENDGVSHARNVGLSLAEGEYICFVDSDDWVEKNYVEKLLHFTTETKSDLTMCGWYEEQKAYRLYPDNTGCKEMDSDEMMKYLFSFFSGHYFALWNKLFRKEFTGKFQEDISYLEDGVFICEYLKKVRKVCLINEVLYRYTENNDSLTHTMKPTKERFSAFQGRMRMIGLTEDNSEVNKAAKAHYNETIRWILFTCYKSGYKKEIAPYVGEIKRFSKEFFSLKSVSAKMKLRYFGYGIIVRWNLGQKAAQMWEKLRSNQ